MRAINFFSQMESYEELVVTGDSTNIFLQKYFKFRNNIISQIQSINTPTKKKK